MNRGIYGVVDENYNVIYVGRTKQIERRLAMLRHPPWRYGDDRYTPIPLRLEPFPFPAPHKLAEQSAIDFYRKEAKRKRSWWRKR